MGYERKDELPVRTHKPHARTYSVRRSWAAVKSRPLLVLLALVVALGPMGKVAAIFQAPTDASPATGDAQVIAHGVVDIPASDLVWRIEREVAPLPASASQSTAATGFLLGAEGSVLVEDTPAGDQSRLAAGEALLTRAGTAQLRAAMGANAASYFVISLATADSVGSASGELVFASEPFAGLGGRHDVDLVRGVLAAADTTVLPAGAGPTLLFVTAGAADITTAAGEIVTLAADQAIALSGPLVATAGPEGATLQAAVIGPAVPRLTGSDAPAAIPATPVAESVASPTPATTTAPIATPTAAEEPDESSTSVPTTIPATTEAPAEPVAADADGDGLNDADETSLNTDPASVDTDGDGLIDGDEVQVHGTQPLAPDTDGDGFLDGDEVAQGTDPLSPASFPGAPVDSDGDGLPDSIEVELGTDPADTDTDDDGLTDGDEYYVYQTGTRNPDNDGDGVIDGAEIENGTDPNDPNSF